MKIALSKPVVVAGKDGAVMTVTELNFREEVVAGDMRGVAMRDPMYFEDMLKIAGRLCAQPDPVMNGLSFADMGKVMEVVGSFLGSGPKTETKPSP